MDVAPPPPDPARTHDALPEALRHLAWPIAPAAFLIGVVAATALIVLTSPKLPDAPWTERARAAHPTRTTLALVAIVLPLLSAFLAKMNLDHDPVIGGGFAVIGCGIASFLGVDLVRWWNERRVHRRPISIVGWYVVKPMLLVMYGAHLLVIGVATCSVSDRFDAPTIWIVGVTTVTTLAIGTGALWMVLAMVGVLRPAPERLLAAVGRAVEHVGVSPDKTWVIPTLGVPFANAFALPILRRVAFTQRSLDILDDDELSAIAAHELGHVGEPRGVAWSRALKSLTYLPIVLVRPAAPEVRPLCFLAIAVLHLVFTRVTRALEHRADAAAHGLDDVVYARALTKIYRENMVPAVLAGARTHPSLWDRIVAAKGELPAATRPEPPSRASALLLATAIVVGAGVAFDRFDAWVDRRAMERIEGYLREHPEIERRW